MLVLSLEGKNLIVVIFLPYPFSFRAIQDSQAYMCRTCRHYALEYEIENYAKSGSKLMEGHSGPLQTCPLCHSALLFSTSNAVKK
jgi:hypothetical protein